MKEFEKDIYGNLSGIQRYVLVLLQSNGFKAIKGNLWLQKELFLLSQSYEDLKEESEFEPYLLGPHSEVIEEEFSDLIQVGLVTKEGYKIKLTNLGKKIALKISEKINDEGNQLVSDLKEFLNDLSEDELLGFIYFSYPEMRKESLKFQKIKRKRETIAISLYRKGKVSLGKAAEIAGMTIETFISLLKRMNIEVYRQ